MKDELIVQQFIGELTLFPKGLAFGREKHKIFSLCKNLLPCKYIKHIYKYAIIIPIEH